MSRIEREQAAPIVGLGAGSHAKSVVDAIRSRGEYAIAALVDDDPAVAGSALLGTLIRGPEALAEARREGVALAFCGIGGVATSAERTTGFTRLVDAGFELPPIVHATAIVAPSAKLGGGCHILAGAVVNADAEIGGGAIVNTGAIVEHDCKIGAHAHVAPGACIGGLVSVGTGAHIGIGATLIERLRVGDGAFVAAGAVVVGDVGDGERVAGIPARPLP